jgi:hypothetical protein
MGKEIKEEQIIYLMDREEARQNTRDAEQK